MRTKKGIVTSAKMQGTVTVTVHTHEFHPVYKKRYRKSKKFACDTAGKDVYLGDEVSIEECRPISKTKHFKVSEILKAAPRVSDIKEDENVAKVIHREKKGADADAKAAKEKEEGEMKKEKDQSGSSGPQAEEATETEDSSSSDDSES